MKVLFICNYGLLYGANRSLMSVVEFFHEQGVNLTVLIPANGSMAQELERKGIPFKVFRFFPTILYVKPILKHLVLPFCFLYDILLFPILLYITKKQNPDIIYSNTSAENIGVLLSKVLGKKHISHVREFMSLDHNAHFLLGDTSKRKYLSLSDGLIFVSKAVANHVMQGRQLKPGQQVIYNGLTTKEKLIENKEIPTEINFGIVGVLQDSKGHKLCIEYFTLYLAVNPNIVLNIFGEGYGFYEKQLKEIVANLNLEKRIVFHGFVKDASEIYKNIDILLVFARSEGFGRVTIEAMLRGIPVIGFNAAGTTELISHGNTGYLFSDYGEFLNSLRQLLSSREQFNLIREQAYNNAITQFSEKEYCLNVLNFVKKIA